MNKFFSCLAVTSFLSICSNTQLSQSASDISWNNTSIPYILNDFSLLEATNYYFNASSYLHKKTNDLGAMDGMSFSLKKAEYNGLGVKLKFPYNFSITSEDGYYLVDDDNLDIHICEKSIEEVKRSMEQEFVFLYNAYAQEKDENLTKGAQMLKKKLISITEEVYNVISEN